MHVLAPAPLYAESPHSVHDTLPAALNVPAAHWVTVDEPWQTLPAGQRVHVSRMVAVPPAVKDVLRQAWQLPAPAAE